MFALDLFNTKYERALQEGALDDTISRTQAHLMEPLSRRAAEIRTELRSGKLSSAQIQQLEREYEDLVDKRMKILKGEITSQEECMGYGGIVGEDEMAEWQNSAPGEPAQAGLSRVPFKKGLVRETGLPDIADKAAKMARLNQPGRAGTDTVTPQQRVNPNPNKGVVGHAVDWLRGKGGPGKEGPTYESELDEAYGTVGSKALMNGNFAEFLKRRASREPYDMDFGSEKIRITPALMDAMAKKYMDDKNASDASPKNRDLKLAAVDNYRAFGYPDLMKKLIAAVATPGDTPAPGEPGEQLPMFEKAQRVQKKNSKKAEPDLNAGTAQDATVQRELQKVRARHPTARTDIEALVKDEIDNQERVDQALAQQRSATQQQTDQLARLSQVNQQQDAKINSLQKQLATAAQSVRPTAPVTRVAPATTKQATPATTATAPTTVPAVTPSTLPEPVAARDQELYDKVKELDDLAKAATLAALQRPNDQDAQAELKQQIDALQKQIEKLNKKKTKKKMNYKKVQKPITGKEAPALPDPNTIDVDAFEVPNMDIPSQDDLVGTVPNDDTAANRPEEFQQAAESVEKPTGIGQMAKRIGQGQELQKDPEYRRSVRDTQQQTTQRQRNIARSQAGYGDDPDDFSDIPDRTEGSMNRLNTERQDLEHMSGLQFEKAYGMTKQEWRNQHPGGLPRVQHKADIIGLPDDDIDTARVKPNFDRTGRMVRTKPTNTQQGMRRMMGKPKQTRPAATLEPVEVTMQVPNRKTDRYDLLPARIFNNEAEAREFARKVNGHITSIKPVMHEGQWGGSGAAGLRDHYAVYTKQNGQVKRIKSTNKIGRPMNTREAEAYVAAMMRKDPTKWTHDTVWVAPADIDIDEGWKNAVASAALAGATALGAPTAHAGSVQAGALQQALKQQVSMKTQLPKPQVPQAPQPKPDDEKKEPAKEAANTAQQAAIAINMKKHHVKPKHMKETVTDVKAEMARVYHKLAPKIERYRDSFLAGQLYDELENIAELHGAETEFKRMISGARNRAHMDYDTNPGGFENWFWYLPFEDKVNEHGGGVNGMNKYIAWRKNANKERGITKEDAIPGKMVTQGFVVEYNPATRTVTISKRGQELDRFVFKGVPTSTSFKKTITQRVKALEDDLYGADGEAGAVSLSRVKVPGRGYGYQELSEDAMASRQAAEESIFKRILVKHRNLIKEFGCDKIVQAVESVVYNIGDLGNISEGDVSTWVHQVRQILGAQ